MQQARDTDSKRVNGIGITIGKITSTDNRSGLLFYFEGLFEKGQSPDEEEDDGGQNDGTDNGPIDNHLDLMPFQLEGIRRLGIDKPIAKEFENGAPGNQSEDDDINEEKQ